MQSIIISFINLFSRFMETAFAPYISKFSGTFQKVTAVVQFIQELFDMVNFFIPVDVIFVCIQIMIGYYVASFVLWIFLWLLRRVADIIP